MIKNILLASLAIGLLTIETLFAQGFIAPVEDLTSAQCQVTLHNGEAFSGKIRMAMIVNGTLRSINVKKENGEKGKYKAEQIKMLRVKMTGLAKIDAFVNSTSSIKEMQNTNLEEVIDREYVIYEQALLPKKKDKFALLQLLNPGFDERIKVYHDPAAKETKGIGVAGVKLTGGEDKSYLIVKDGDKSMKIKKGSFKKVYPELFGDCEKMTDFGNDKIKFGELAGYVAYFNKNCQ